MFDLDGTIVDTETIEYQSIRDVWAMHSADYTIAHFEHVIGTTIGPDWIEELQQVLGTSVDTRAALAHRREVKQRLLDAAVARDGIVSLIEQASAVGIPMAIASNSPLDWVEARLTDLALRHHMTALISIDVASLPKPHPEPYLEACAALGADPGLSVAFEDSATGVTSALAAGLYTVACAGPLTLGHDLSRAHRVIQSHRDVSLHDLGRAVRS